MCNPYSLRSFRFGGAVSWSLLIGYSLKDSASSAISAVNYTYGTTGRLETVSDGTDTFTYSYEANSYLLASLTAPKHTVAYDYEDNRNVMTVVDNQVSDSSLSKYTYTYDALGRRADRTQSGSALTTSTDDFGYNSRSEVISSDNNVQAADAFNPTYTYDPIGNRSTSTGIDTVTYTANELNQYSAIGSDSPIHDLDGNLTNDGSWTYSWNNENRLIKATDGGTVIDFVYDYQGRLVKKDDGSNVEVYVYDGWDRIAKYVDGSDAETYLWGLDLSGSMQGAGGVGGLLKEGSLYPTYDANGNIVQKLDGSGTTVMTVEYDPFGNIISGTLVGEYGFSTKPLLESIDWYYYGFRYYDPVTGRWPSRDPIGEAGGLNLYGMVGNDPVNKWDLLGLRRNKPCCGSIVYMRNKECCVKKKIFRKKKQATGVQSCIVEELAGHRYLVLPDGSTLGGVAFIADSPDPFYPSKKHKEQKCHDIKLSQCKYDIGKFQSCLFRKAAMSGGCYVDNSPTAFNATCIGVVSGLLRDCKAEAKR